MSIHKIGFTILLFIVMDFLAGYLFIDDAKTRATITRQSHSYFHHTLRPFINFKDKWGENYYQLTTNNLGFKDHSNQVIANTVDKKRILFMGDSFTEGIGVPFEKTFSGLVKKKYPHLDVLNAGCVSYSPKFYYLKSKYLLEKAKLKFNELFVFIDISDIQDEIVYANFKENAEIDQTLPTSASNDFRDYAIQHSLLANRLYRIYLGDIGGNDKKSLNSDKLTYQEVIEKKPEKWIDYYPVRYFKERDNWTTDPIFDDWGKKGLQLAEKNMVSLVDLCYKHQVKLTIAVYPWPRQIRNKELSSKQVSFWEKFSENQEISFINYFPMFIDTLNDSNFNQFFIPNDVHWNEKGHQLIANNIIID